MIAVKGLVLAGSRREFCRYLYDMGYKEREYPQIHMFNQLQGYYETPPIICVGTYYKNEKYAEIRKRAVAAGVEVQEYNNSQYSDN